MTPESLALRRMADRLLKAAPRGTDTALIGPVLVYGLNDRVACGVVLGRDGGPCLHASADFGAWTGEVPQHLVDASPFVIQMFEAGSLPLALGRQYAAELADRLRERVPDVQAFTDEREFAHAVLRLFRDPRTRAVMRAVLAEHADRGSLT
jgi:hypothetical protein